MKIVLSIADELSFSFLKVKSYLTGHQMLKANRRTGGKIEKRALKGFHHLLYEMQYGFQNI